MWNRSLQLLERRKTFAMSANSVMSDNEHKHLNGNTYCALFMPNCPRDASVSIIRDQGLSNQTRAVHGIAS